MFLFFYTYIYILIKNESEVFKIMGKCLLSVTKSCVSSYEFDSLKELSDHVHDPSLSAITNKTVEDGDYIILNTNSGKILHMRANIDTYYDKIGKHHIDFISDELIPESYGVKMRDKNNNNGNISQRSPYLLSNVYKSLQWYYNTEIPECIKSHIINKISDVVCRYNPNQVDKLQEYNSSYYNSNCEIGYLWIPYAEETFSRFITVTMSDCNFKQYESLRTGNSRTKKIRTEDINRNNKWWTASASNGSSLSYIIVNEYGDIDTEYATTQTLGVPLCFRFV